MKQPGLLLPLLFALTPAAASAQGKVWVVDDDPGPGVDFATPQEAVDAANDFDMVLIRAGNYGPVEIVDKGLSVVGEEGAILSSFQVLVIVPSPLTVTSLSAGKSLVFRGLTFDAVGAVANGIDELLEAAHVLDCDGSVVFEDCRLLASAGSGLNVSNSAAVTLHRCEVDAGGSYYYSFNNEYWDQPGLRSANSDLYLYDTTVKGTLGPDAQSVLFTDFPPGAGGEGAVVSGGSFTIQGSSVEGGPGGSGVVQFCSPGFDGGAGIRHSGAEVRYLDSAVTGGTGGLASPGCGEPDGTSGASFDGDPLEVTALDGLARHFTWESPVHGGENFTTIYEGQAGDFIFHLMSVFLGPDQYFATLGATLLVANDYVILPLGNLPAGGTLQFDFTAPPLGGANEFVQLVGQVAYFDAVEGVVLSGASVLDILE